MAINWLFGGPRVSRDGLSFAVCRSQVINLSDVRDVVTEVASVCAKVLVLRGTAAMQASGALRTRDPIDLDNPSDADLRDVHVVGFSHEQQIARLESVGPEYVTPTIEVVIGSAANASCTITLQDPLLDTPATSVHHDQWPKISGRIERLLTSGRARIPAWRWAQLAWVALVLVLAAAWLRVSAQAWPSLELALVTLAGVVAFAWAAKTRWTLWQQSRNIYAGQGRVAIDPSPRERMRLERANSRRDWRVAIVSILATAAAAVVTVLLSGGLGGGG